MRKGRVSECILTSSHLIPVASARAIWRVPRLVCVLPKSVLAPHCHTLGSMSDMAIIAKLYRKVRFQHFVSDELGQECNRNGGRSYDALLVEAVICAKRY
jgi:hypothetical protein